MKKLTFKTKNYEDTMKLGYAVSNSLTSGSGILLMGDLGAGKTTIISGICKGLGVDKKIKSPTFVIAWVYDSPKAPIYHIDLYRLGDYFELEEIGWEEMVDESKIYLVEWADKFPLPYTENAIKIFLYYGETQYDRTIEINFKENIFPTLEKDLQNYEYFGN